MSSIPTPPVVPPMRPRARALLYGVFAWAAVIVAAGLVGVGSVTGFGVDVPQPVSITLATAQAIIGTVWGWLGFVAKANTPGQG